MSVKELVAGADSVTFCLSKGLAAPIGSVLCGSKEFIYKAHRARKQLGGGMRQAGVVAVAGIVALETMTKRLIDDHIRAQELANGLKTIDGISLEKQYTNMVYFELDNQVALSVEDFLAAILEQGLMFGNVGGRQFRLVTHVGIDEAMAKKAIKIINEVISENS